MIVLLPIKIWFLLLHPLHCLWSPERPRFKDCTCSYSREVKLNFHHPKSILWYNGMEWKPEESLFQGSGSTFGQSTVICSRKRTKVTIKNRIMENQKKNLTFVSIIYNFHNLPCWHVLKSISSFLWSKFSYFSSTAYALTKTCSSNFQVHEDTLYYSSTDGALGPILFSSSKSFRTCSL